MAATTGKSGVKLNLRAGSAGIEITVGTSKSTTPNCTTAPDNPFSACVTVHGQLPPPLAAAGVQGILRDIKLLQLPTTDVIR